MGAPGPRAPTNRSSFAGWRSRFWDLGKHELKARNHEVRDLGVFGKCSKPAPRFSGQAFKTHLLRHTLRDCRPHKNPAALPGARYSARTIAGRDCSEGLKPDRKSVG